MLRKMSAYNRISIFALFFILLGYDTSVGDQLEKKIVKSFNVKPDTRIIVNNKFGTVHVNTWAKDQVHLQVEIVVNGKNQKKTQDMMDDVSVTISDHIQAGYLKFQTEIGPSKGSRSLEINYIIDMPAKNDLDVSNSFGNIYLQNLEGNADITLKYGQLLAEDIRGKSEILMTFGSGWNRIGALGDADVTVKYSKVKIEAAGSLNLNDQFSDAKLGKIGALDLKCKYGDIEIEEVDEISGSGAFSGLEIGRLNKSISINGKYGDGITVEHVSNRFSNIDINIEFSGVELWFDPGARARLDLRLSFGSFRTDRGSFTFTRVIKNQNTSEYGGYLNSENATSKIRIDTKYGDIRLNVRE